MLLKVQEVDCHTFVTNCKKIGEYMLIFTCHKKGSLQSFEEVLKTEDFKKRLVKLNTRIKFPEDAVKTTLVNSDFLHATMEPEPNAAGVFVLALKYSMAETSTPLKWEWHLKPTRTLEFYREVLLDTLRMGTTMHGIIRDLTKELCAKDNELQQFRREGYELRRSTVRTSTFDVLEFDADNRELFEEASTYGNLKRFFLYTADSPLPTTPSTTSSSSSTGSSSTRVSSSTSSTLTHITISSSSSSNPSEKSGSSNSPKVARSRKRKVQAINSKRLEQKVKQRMLESHVQFNSQSSQEDDLVDWLVQGAIEPELEPKPEPNLTIKTETEEAPQAPKVEDAAEVNPEETEEPEKKATTVTEEAPQSPKVEDAAEVKTEDTEEPEEKATTVTEEAPQSPKVEDAAEVKTEETEEPEEKATTVPEEENNNESLTESDQELNELRSILAASMAQNRQNRGE